ncbi:DUF302 domain-containing protein [Falsiroseomonas selenitidurans]|uniref:DUF302 domain-containing protein n=1 Tax=Falsiroseomonas selenitidurans TaxID=2716335 RepID=A0ABX1DY64_9PROT|nr:DUF302 domain-containing protein [Falsiroseomonas selenitidurans]NKC29849.1 DUF302 domain-containing protein [Falsiroseomonas selenitidurans]
MRRILLLTALAAALTQPAPLQAAGPGQDGLVTLPSAHALRPTLDRFAAAVRAAGWKVFGEVDHAEAAREAGLPLRGRTVVLFGNPAAGTPGMAANPTLALDLPMRVLVWEDDQGGVHITRSSGADIASRVFARHGVAIPPEGQRGTEALLERLTRQAVQ